MIEDRWYKNAVIYSLEVETFLDASGDAEDAAAYWSRWPSLPAVAKGRVVALPPAEVTLPGPYPDRGLARLAAELHRSSRPPRGGDRP